MTSLALNRIDGSGFYAVDPRCANGGVSPGLGLLGRALFGGLRGVEPLHGRNAASTLWANNTGRGALGLCIAGTNCNNTHAEMRAKLLK